MADSFLGTVGNAAVAALGFGGGAKATPAAPVTTPTPPVNENEGTQPVSQPVVTSGPSRSTFTQNSNQLQTYISQLGGEPTPNNPNPDDTAAEENADPIIQGLQNLQKSSDAATKSLIASTMATYQNKINATTKQYQNYKAGLQQLGIETNAAEATPDILAGHIQAAANDGLAKVNDLKAQEAQAIIKAQTAQQSNDFKSLDEQMTRLNTLQTQKADAIKNMYDTLSSTSKAESIEAHDIYDQMQTLDPADKEKYILAVSAKYGFNPADLVTALNDEQTKQNKAAIALAKSEKSLSTSSGSGGYKASQKDITSLQGIGASESDIATIENDINQFGAQAVYDKNSDNPDLQTWLASKFGITPPATSPATSPTTSTDTSSGNSTK